MSVVDRQWLAVDNGASTSSIDNTIFLAFHETLVGTFIYSSPGSTGATDPVGGLVYQNSGDRPGALQPLAADAICAKLRFDPVTRNLYYACDEGNHIRVTVGHVAPGQRTGIEYANYNAPRTPGGGSVLNLFPSLATDKAGNVYVAWIDKTNFNVYYSFSTDQGKSWSAPVRVNNNGSATNEFDWAEAGNTGLLSLAWYGTPRTAVGGSDGMPSSLADQGAATAYPWYGYTALVKNANTAKPQILQARYSVEADALRRDVQLRDGVRDGPSRRSPDGRFLRLRSRAERPAADRVRRHDERVRRRGALRQTAARRPDDLGTNLSATPAADPVSDSTGDAQCSLYSPLGLGPEPRRSSTSAKLKVPNPTPTTVRFQSPSAEVRRSSTPPPGKTTPLWLVRFQALGPLARGGTGRYHVYYIYVRRPRDAVPQVYGGVAACQSTTPDELQDLPVPRRHRPSTGR